MDIEPHRLYSFAEAARLIPSSHAGKTVHIVTLRRWRAQGRFAAICRQAGKRRYWFLPGVVILALSRAQDVEWQGRTPTERRSAVEAARKRFEELSGRRGCQRNSAKAAAKDGRGRNRGGSG